MKLNKEILLKSVSLTKHFNGILAVDNVSLELKKSEIIGIMGANGSGKTSFINLLCRFIDPDSGELYIKGKSYENIKPHDLFRFRVSRSFQHIHNWKNLSLYDNLSINAVDHNSNFIKFLFKTKVVKESEKSLREKIVYISKLLAVEDHLTNKLFDNSSIVSNLSLGEQKIIELLRIFISEPQILLLDEPSVALNDKILNNLISYLKLLVQKGMGTIIISHDENFLRACTSNIFIMSEGKLLN